MSSERKKNINVEALRRELAQFRIESCGELESLLHLVGGTLGDLAHGEREELLGTLVHDPVLFELAIDASREVGRNQNMQSTLLQDAGYDSIGFTRLARGGNWNEFDAELRQYLPAIAVEVGLPQHRADDLRGFILNTVKTSLGGARFRDRLMQWLREFAQQEGLKLKRQDLGDDDLARVIEEVQVRRALSDTNLPSWLAPWVRWFEQREQWSLQSLRESRWPDDLPADPESRILFPDYHGDLVLHTMDRTRQGCELFEVNWN